MPHCDVCGNEYDKALEVRQHGATHWFDCFECAIQALAPICAHCGCRVVGHGIESAGHVYCCARCAARSGVYGFRDRIDEITVTG